MTTTQLKAANKAAIIEYVETLKGNLAKSQAETQEAVKIANYFGAIIAAIEVIINKAPFLNQEGKFFKKLWWVVSNFKSIVTLIEEIVARIKEWRSQVNKLVANNVITDSSIQPESTPETVAA